MTQFAKAKDETWEKAARDRMKWSSWEDEFAAKRWGKVFGEQKR